MTREDAETLFAYPPPIRVEGFDVSTDKPGTAIPLRASHSPVSWKKALSNLSARGKIALCNGSKRWTNRHLFGCGTPDCPIVELVKVCEL